MENKPEKNSWEMKFYLFLHYVGIYIFIPSLIVLMGTDVFLRYYLNSPLVWGNEVSAYILFMIFGAGLAYCTAKKEHLVMELLYDKMPPFMKGVSDGISALCGLFYSLFLTWQCYVSTLESIEYGDGGEMIDLPFWPFSLFLGLSGLALTLHFVLTLIRLLTPSRRKS